MKIENFSFPQPGVCRAEVSESAGAYQAAVQQLYQRRRRFYPVEGWPGGDAPLEAIEAKYGLDTFRVDAIDHLLLHAFPALRAALCAEQGLFPLTDTEPELLRVDADGFAAACTFAVAPAVQLPPYTGRTAAGDTPAAALNALVAGLAREAGVVPPDYAVRAECEARLDSLQQRLKDGKMTLAQFLEQAQKTQADLEADLRAGASEALTQKIILIQIARNEGLFPSGAELEAEIDRMVALSGQNAYARTNPAAQQSIAGRMALNRAVEFLRSHNTLG